MAERPLTARNRPENGLRRSLSVIEISLYGIGTIVGAGIYALLGKVAGLAGTHLPLSFLLAGLIAAFTALSHAELCARFPQSAGAAIYVYEALRRPWAAQLTALLIALTGLVSAATLTRGFVGYLHLFVDIPGDIAMLLVILLLTGIACWGVRLSAAAVSAITLVELLGLVYVIVTGLHAEPVTRVGDMFVVNGVQAWSGVILGSFLAFYAYIGFEDMVNMAEEVRQPEKNLPHAIIIAITLTTVLYLLVAVAALRSTSLAQLTNSNAPLAEIISRAGHPVEIIGAIGLFAVINGALVQLIMSSRLLYGLAERGMAPALFRRVDRRTQTPIAATLPVAAAVALFALWLPLETLARITSSIMLLVFAAVNLSLIAIKQRGVVDYSGPSYPTVVPVVGLLLTLALLCAQLLSIDPLAVAG